MPYQIRLPYTGGWGLVKVIVSFGAGAPYSLPKVGLSVAGVKFYTGLCGWWIDIHKDPKPGGTPPLRPYTKGRGGKVKHTTS
jgi:hypothetical protein